MASTYLTRNITCNRQKWTWSAWVKRSKINSYQNMFASGTSGSNDTAFNFNGDDTLSFYHRQSSSIRGYFQSSAKLRDCNGWYHLVANFDSTNGTGADRLVVYVNNERAIGTMHNTLPQNDSGYIGNGSASDIGRMPGGSANYFDGVISHINFCDGYIYQPSAFGSTDSTTGEWKINTSPNVQYGTNGFFILKDGNSVTDQSPNTNNFTVGGGTLTKTEDNPSNVFATLNPLVPDAGSTGLFHGNNQLNVNTANWRSAFSTLGMSSGKFYFESYIEGGSYIHIGARGVEQSDGSLAGNNDWIGVTSQGWSYDKTGEVRNNNSSVASGKATFGNTDIIGCLLDLDNWTINWTKNGTLINSTAYNITQNLTYVFGVSGHSTARILTNFGNGNFSSTTISSQF